MKVRDSDELSVKRDSINLKTTAQGDYVLYRFTKKWYRVSKLVNVKSVIYADCLDPHGVTHRLLASECYPSWNPRTKSFGREPNSSRKSYWLP